MCACLIERLQIFNKNHQKRGGREYFLQICSSQNFLLMMDLLFSFDYYFLFLQNIYFLPTCSKFFIIAEIADEKSSLFYENKCQSCVINNTWNKKRHLLNILKAFSPFISSLLIQKHSRKLHLTSSWLIIIIIEFSKLYILRYV